MKPTLSRHTIRFLILCLFAFLLGQPRSAYTRPVEDMLAQRVASLVQADNVRLLGQWGGVTNAVYIVANRAYIGEGPRLIILDVTNPAQPTMLGKTGPLPGVIEDLVVVDSTAYVAIGESGFSIVDVTIPTSPNEVSSYDTPGYAKGVAVVDSTLYVAAGWEGGLRIVNVANPASPNEVGFYDTPGVASGVSVVGSLAYVADGGSGLRIVNVVNPASPSELGFYDTPSSATKVSIVGTTAYVADGESGLRIVNVANPTSLSEIGFYDTPGFASSVFLMGSIAYVADGWKGGLRIVNVENPASPSEIGFYDALQYGQAVAVIGSTAYLADGESGLQIIDVTNPASPHWTGSYDAAGSVFGITVVGSTAYVANDQDGLRIMNVTNPASPAEIGFYNTPGSAIDVFVIGSTAYVADGESGLRIVNVTNPASPSEIGFYDTPGFAWNVSVVGSIAYVADLYGGLRIIDVTNPTSPVEVGFYATPDNVRSVVVIGSIAYVAVGWSGLRILDVTNPANPSEIGFYDTSGFAEGVSVVGSVAYVTDGSSGLRIVNVTNPASPIEVGFYDTSGSATKISLVGSIAYVTDGLSGLRVMDVENPASPREVSYYNTSGRAWALSVADSTVYVADLEGGLAILQYPACYRLTLLHTEAGNNPTANPTNSPGCANGQYLPQTIITLTANPASDYAVSNWSGTINDTSTSTSNSLLMPTHDVAVTVHYRKLPTATPTLTSTPTRTPTLTPTSTATHTPSGIGDAFENDDACPTARTITTNSSIQTHTFHKPGDADWLRFDATLNKFYRIDVTIPDGSTADVDLTLYNSCDSVPADQWNASFTPSVRLEFTSTVTGAIYLRLSNYDATVAGANVKYEVSVRQLTAETTNRALIIVAGRLRGADRLQSNIHNVTQRVYTLFQRNDYTDDNIYYLATDSRLAGYDAAANKANLKAAITQWAKEKLPANGVLTLYLIDHGSPELFYLDDVSGQRLTPDELNDWLTQLEDAVSGLKINVIIEACESGSFINLPGTISKAGRIVVTSTNADYDAKASKDGAYFSDHLLTWLHQGYNLSASFLEASIVAKRVFALQTAWLDANGNGIPNEFEDAALAAQRSFAYEGTLGGDDWPPYIFSVEGPQAITNASGQISVDVRDNLKVRTVWAVVYPPDYTPPVAQEELQAESLPTILLSATDNGDIYAGAYPGFIQSGVYRIVVHAEDNDGLVARPVEIEVTVGSKIFLPLVMR